VSDSRYLRKRRGGEETHNASCKHAIANWLVFSSGLAINANSVILDKQHAVETLTQISKFESQILDVIENQLPISSPTIPRIVNPGLERQRDKIDRTRMSRSWSGSGA
jgi:hypothetical protein